MAGYSSDDLTAYLRQPSSNQQGYTPQQNTMSGPTSYGPADTVSPTQYNSPTLSGPTAFGTADTQQPSAYNGPPRQGPTAAGTADTVNPQAYNAYVNNGVNTNGTPLTNQPTSADVGAYYQSNYSTPYIPAGTQSYGGLGNTPMPQAPMLQANPLTTTPGANPLSMQAADTAQSDTVAKGGPAGSTNAGAPAPQTQMAAAAGVSQPAQAPSVFNPSPPPGGTIKTPAQAGITYGGGGGGDGIVNTANAQLGGKYVYGGTDPKTGVDCSAFTQEVLAQNGIHTGRDTTAQWADPQGQVVGRGMGDLANARPGDLLFFGDPNGGEHAHVGIYQGNGQMISAANPDRGVTTDSVAGWNQSGEQLFGIKRFGSSGGPANLASFNLDPNEQYIINHESSGSTTAENPSSHAFGLGQLNPSSGTLQEYASRFGFNPRTTDPTQQMQMFRAYVKDRYGSSQAAADHERALGWY